MLYLEEIEDIKVMMMETKIALLRRKIKTNVFARFSFRLWGNNMECAILANSPKRVFVTLHCNLLMWLIHMIFRFKSQRLQEIKKQRND